MSGGHFDYLQYRIREIADTIERDLTGRELDEEDIEEIERDVKRGWTEKEYLDYCKEHMRTPPDALRPETKREFQRGYVLLRLAEVYAQRIDWLQSGDDGEDTFHERLAEDLEALDKELEEKDPALLEILQKK